MKTNGKFQHKDRYLKFLRDFRMIIYLIIFTMSGIVINSCVGGYVASEPTYDYGYDRPASPGEAYIWIDGDWLWNNRTHSYEHERGYWARPRNGRSYEAGRWNNGPRGKYWIKGQWRRSGNNNNLSNRDRNRDRDRDRDRDHDRDKDRDN